MRLNQTKEETHKAESRRIPDVNFLGSLPMESGSSCLPAPTCDNNHEDCQPQEAYSSISIKSFYWSFMT